MPTVYTARNGSKYIKLANGRCRFVKRSTKSTGKSSGKKKKGGGYKVGGSMKQSTKAVHYS